MEEGELAMKWPKGSRVELVHTSDPYTNLQPGDRGTVVFVDDLGTLFVNWDNGSSLGMVPGQDQYRVVEDE
jgi:hypothetical protein